MYFVASVFRGCNFKLNSEFTPHYSSFAVVFLGLGDGRPIWSSYTEGVEWIYWGAVVLECFLNSCVDFNATFYSQ